MDSERYEVLDFNDEVLYSSNSWGLAVTYLAQWETAESKGKIRENYEDGGFDIVLDHTRGVHISRGRGGVVIVEEALTTMTENDRWWIRRENESEQEWLNRIEEHNPSESEEVMAVIRKHRRNKRKGLDSDSQG